MAKRFNSYAPFMRLIFCDKVEIGVYILMVVALVFVSP